MSDPRSALNGASFDGQVTIRESGPMGMITLRGVLAAPAMARALEAALGLPVPARRCIATSPDGTRQVGWMSPDEVLLVLPRAQVTAALAAIEAALAGTHHLAADVSDARALFTLTGPAARLREVLAKLSPVDFHPNAFPTGELRRTRLAQVAGAVWLSSDDTAHVICFRSVARYVFDLLSHAADPAAVVDYYR